MHVRAVASGWQRGKFATADPKKLSKIPLNGVLLKFHK